MDCCTFCFHSFLLAQWVLPGSPDQKFGSPSESSLPPSLSSFIRKYILWFTSFKTIKYFRFEFSLPGLLLIIASARFSSEAFSNPCSFKTASLLCHSSGAWSSCSPNGVSQLFRKWRWKRARPRPPQTWRPPRVGTEVGWAWSASRRPESHIASAPTRHTRTRAGFPSAPLGQLSLGRTPPLRVIPRFGGFGEKGWGSDWVSLILTCVPSAPHPRVLPRFYQRPQP